VLDKNNSTDQQIVDTVLNRARIFRERFYDNGHVWDDSDSELLVEELLQLAEDVKKEVINASRKKDIDVQRSIEYII
jgi:hypothetical protein